MNFTLGGVVYPEPLLVNSIAETVPVASSITALAIGNVPPSGGSVNVISGGF